MRGDGPQLIFPNQSPGGLQILEIREAPRSRRVTHNIAGTMDG